MKRSLLSLAVTASLGLASASAFATFEDFQVDTTPFSSSPKTFIADKITGNYSEVITFTGVNTFAVSILWNAGQFVKNDGNNPVPTSTSQLNTQYGLYATFQGTGTVVLGPTTLFTLTPGSGSYSMYVDNNLDTDFDDTVGAVNSPANGLLPWIADVGTDLDDVLIATGDTVSGSGLLDTTCSGGINCGSFGQNNTFDLTAAGKTFFVAPVPFYGLAFESGQLNTFVLAGTQQINGSLDLVFQKVPEPTSLALFGLGLAGLGLRRRRSS